MGKHSTRYPAEVRERAVRLVLDHQGDYASQWEAIASVAAKIGCTAETLRLFASVAVIIALNDGDDHMVRVRLG